MTGNMDAALALLQAKTMFDIVHADIWRSEVLIGSSLADEDEPDWKERYDHMKHVRGVALEAFEAYIANMYELARTQGLIKARGINL